MVAVELAMDAMEQARRLPLPDGVRVGGDPDGGNVLFTLETEGWQLEFNAHAWGDEIDYQSWESTRLIPPGLRRDGMYRAALDSMLEVAPDIAGELAGAGTFASRTGEWRDGYL